MYEAAAGDRRAAKLPFSVQGALASLYWKHLGDEKHAETLFKRLRLREPKNPYMLEFYAEQYRVEGNHKRLLTALKSLRPQLEDPEARLAVGVEMADLAENAMSQPERAMDTWKQIADENPGNEQAIGALRRLYTDAGKYNALLEFLKSEADRCPPEAQERRVALLFELADLYRDQMGLETMEINTLGAVLEADPGNAGAIERLVERHHSAEQWEALAGVLEQRADHEDDVGAEVATRRQLAELSRERLADADRAILHLERIVTLSPDDREALADLRELYSRRDAHRPLLRVLERQADLESGEEQLALLREMARIAWEVLGDEDETIAVSNRLLEATDRKDLTALGLLEALHRKHARWSELVEVLHAKRELQSSAADQVEILLQIGAIQTEQLEQLD